MNTKFFKSRLIALLLSMALVSVASAQNTSSSARGTITNTDGSPVANATVTITYDLTGSARTATTGANGYFFQPGLRIGGPYTVSVTAAGYHGAQVGDLHFSPGTQAPLNLVIESTSVPIEEIVVSAQASPLRDLNNGVGSAFSAEDIANSTGGARDVIRTVLRDPLADSQDEGHLQVAGSNPRFNGIAIDGSLQTDDFGLNNDGVEGLYSSYATQRSPINLDAVESVSLVASDYDVTTSGFTGGLVSLTTKSGTNEWDGSAIYYWQKDSYFGDDYDTDRTFDPGPVDEKEYGVTLGGPIIKDKLFFFVSYDEFESAKSIDYSQFDEDNGLAPGFFDALATVVNSSLGYDPGTRPQTANTPAISERALVKVDWDISDLHRASFTYQSTEEQGTSTIGNGFAPSWYDAPIDLEAYTFQLFSDWNDSLSTTLRYNFKDYERGQFCRAGRVVGDLSFTNLDVGDLTGTPLEGMLLAGYDGDSEITAGCDSFRHTNEYNDERTQFFAKADYIAGNHVITAGFEYGEFDLFNLFLPDSLGLFEFNSFDDLVNGDATVSYQNDISNDSSQAAQSWGFKKWAIFLQDSIQISPDLELGFGVRFEQFDQSAAPVFSQPVFDTYGVDTTNNLDGLDLILPRVSFRWTPSDRITLTGGVGLFAGGDPLVWTSNAFQLPTVSTSGDFTGVNPTVVPQTLLDNVASGSPVPVDYISSDFETPSDWKASLRLEQVFDIGSSEDYVFTAQYLYTTPKDGFRWTNLAQTSNPATTPGVAPDGRPIYADLDDLGIPNLTELTNHSGGESHVIAIALAKQYDFGLDFNLSYAYQDVDIVTEGGSSRGISNFRGILGSDKNNPSPHASRYSLEHSFKLNLGYQKDFFGSGQSMTRFDVFARRMSGDRFAHTFNTGSNNALFGRPFSSRNRPFDTDAVYIPTGPSDPAVVYASSWDAGEQAEFDGYLKNISGTGIIEPGTSSAGWNTTMDIRIQQEIPGLSFLGNSLGDNNFRVVLDIENFLNLLNDDWGLWKDGPFFIDNDIVTADLVTVADVAANGVDGATALTGDMPRVNCLSQSDCVYRFNSFRDRDFSFSNGRRSVYKIRLGVRFDF